MNKFRGFGLHYVALLLFFAACDAEKQRQLHDVSGHLPELAFSLNSDSGLAVTAQSFRGYQILLFFGYTRCASECPATLFRLAKIMRKLGRDADRTRILFVSLAPRRDTPEVLRRYLWAFDAEHAVGLTGDEAEIEALAKRYRVAFRPDAADTDDIPHGAAVYVFDARGHARLLMTPDDAVETVVNDLRRLAAEAGT